MQRLPHILHPVLSLSAQVVCTWVSFEESWQTKLNTTRQNKRKTKTRQFKKKTKQTRQNKAKQSKATQDKTKQLCVPGT